MHGGEASHQEAGAEGAADGGSDHGGYAADEAGNDTGEEDEDRVSVHPSADGKSSRGRLLRPEAVTIRIAM